MKTVNELIEEIRKDIKGERKSIKEYSKNGQYEDALRSQQFIMNMEYVIDLAEGKLD